MPEAQADLVKIENYYQQEFPGNQEGYPAHLDAIADKLEELIAKYPAKAEVLKGAVAVFRDLATPDWMKDLSEMSGGRRRKTRKHKRRAHKTRRAYKLH
jgi:hypothetical protein